MLIAASESRVGPSSVRQGAQVLGEQVKRPRGHATCPDVRESAWSPMRCGLTAREKLRIMRNTDFGRGRGEGTPVFAGADSPAAMSVTSSVNICADTTSRWLQLRGVVASVDAQEPAADRISVVTDDRSELGSSLGALSPNAASTSSTTKPLAVRTAPGAWA